MANVYGVEVAGGDSRAGTAALALAERAEFDPRAFYAHAVSSLPLYAVPVLVRVQREAEVVSDRLFVRDDAAKSYVPLDAARHRAVCEGRLRF